MSKMAEGQLNESMSRAPGWQVRADSGRFACQLVHPPDTTSCKKDFASKQGLEVHRRRMAVQDPNLPSRRTVSRFFGLDEQDAKSLKVSRNDWYVGNYRRTAKGIMLATFRARHFERAAAARDRSSAISGVRPTAVVLTSAHLLALEQEASSRGRLGGPLREHSRWTSGLGSIIELGVYSTIPTTCR